MADRPTGAELIAAERQRQIGELGYTPEHDAGHGTGDLFQAAGLYVHAALIALNTEGQARAARVLTRLGLDPAADGPIQRMLENPARHYFGWDEAPDRWPWAPEAWKPDPDPVRNLVKAGALIAAEIDRLQAEGA